MPTPPQMKVHLDWDGELRFSGHAGETPLTVDGDAESAPSPVQMLSAGLAACMAIDIVHILTKMRTPASSLAVDLTVRRALSNPHRVVAAAMRFTIVGNVPEKNVARAIDMSRETYCSVWHSLREDIEFETTFEVRGA